MTNVIDHLINIKYVTDAGHALNISCILFYGMRSPRRSFGTREDRFATIVRVVPHIFRLKDNEYSRLLMIIRLIQTRHLLHFVQSNSRKPQVVTKAGNYCRSAHAHRYSIEADRRGMGGDKKGAEVVSEPVKPKPHYWGITFSVDRMVNKFDRIYLLSIETLEKDFLASSKIYIDSINIAFSQSFLTSNFGDPIVFRGPTFTMSLASRMNQLPVIRHKDTKSKQVLYSDLIYVCLRLYPQFKKFKTIRLKFKAMIFFNHGDYQRGLSRKLSLQRTVPMDENRKISDYVRLMENNAISYNFVGHVNTSMKYKNPSSLKNDNLVCLKKRDREMEILHGVTRQYLAHNLNSNKRSIAFVHFVRETAWKDEINFLNYNCVKVKTEPLIFTEHDSEGRSRVKGQGEGVEEAKKLSYRIISKWLPIRTDNVKLDLELIKEPGFYEAYDIFGLRNKRRGSLYDTRDSPSADLRRRRIERYWKEASYLLEVEVTFSGRHRCLLLPEDGTGAPVVHHALWNTEQKQRNAIGPKSFINLLVLSRFEYVQKTKEAEYRAFRICVQHGWLSWRTGGLVLGLMSQAKQRSHVASYITTALCAGTFTCAAALIDVRLCINTSPPPRENPSCVLFNVSDTNAYCMCRMGNVNAKEAPIDRKTGRFCNRVEKFLILPKNQNSLSHSFLRECANVVLVKCAHRRTFRKDQSSV
ncbi:hypothetical protein WN51_01946 [Melipona quadrifasciata]|uniref:Uncharacterized protein n=1 Tax=Melipona quadrifasciata TaxID=166423 RepID=A0A0N1IU60_9HYME|nr:hypothetical protein WN51_01946 [Melipona quadrifasciata]